MTSHEDNRDFVSTRSKTLALIAALLGWLFDGFEMGLFPVIARPALRELLSTSLAGMEAESAEVLVGLWNSITIAGFLVGAAAGGVLFGWLGDRIGRVRAMSLSILTYAVFSGLGAFADAPWQMVAVRFVAALGMGGEWSLGVALVMEVWGGRSRALLAGLIGAAANLGYALVATLSLSLDAMRQTLESWGLSESWVQWRALMLCGVLPAFLTLFVRLFVPESQRWEQEHKSGSTAGWRTQDLIGVLFGVVCCFGIIGLWSFDLPLQWRLLGTGCGLILVAAGYLYPVFQYMLRSADTWQASSSAAPNVIIRRMLIGAMVSGIPLLGTWASVQWATMWADQLAVGQPSAKAYTQLVSALGAVAGGFAGAALGAWAGRRISYVILCLGSFATVWLFYQTNTEFNARFLVTVGCMGGVTAAFYGWLPLYLPELFPTRVRATGQGFSFNFGRILAAIGALQTSAIMQSFDGGYPAACTAMASVYFIGVFVIWLAPETKSKPLDD
ncbi:MAG: MFS transporter [Pirellulaceae bacterium]|nr:MFS transporter [Pirellulaceae bacterium]